MWFNNPRDKEAREDQIEVFKILNGYVNIKIVFSLKNPSRTREHKVTLVNDQCRLDIQNI